MELRVNVNVSGVVRVLLLADSLYLLNNLEFESLSRSGSHHR